MEKIVVKNGEAKTIRFTVKKDNVAVNLTAATGIDFRVAAEYGEAALISKTITDFTTTLAASGIVTCVLTASELDYSVIEPGTDYKSELRITFNSTSAIDISKNIPFVVEDSLYDYS